MRRGLVRVDGVLAVGLLALACGGRVDPNPHGDATDSSSSAGAARARPGDSEPGDAELPSTGGSAPAPGPSDGPNGDQCPRPWWGSSLEGVVGLRQCPPPYDPALLAYGQTQLEACTNVTGPVAEQRAEDGGLRCSYHYDERDCGNDYEGDSWLDVPVFGDGPPGAQLPASVPSNACLAPIGPLVATSTPADQAELLHGVWVTCIDAPDSDPFPGNVMAFLPDGSYRALQTNEQGLLSRAQGCDSTGLWGFIASTGQLNIYLGDRTFITFVSFTGGGQPRRLAFGSSGPGRPFSENAGRVFVAVEWP